MKKLTILLLLVFSCLYTTVQAQDYKSAIGLRLGYPWSISYKQFLNDRGAFEVFGGMRGSTYCNPPDRAGVQRAGFTHLPSAFRCAPIISRQKSEKSAGRPKIFEDV